MQICPKCRTRFENQVERCTHDGRRLVADLTGVTVAGRYLLRELLGVGGMDSSVWLAMQQPVQRPVAVKLLPPTDGESADRFARGARIASNLAHPHITVVHDYGRTDEGQLFLVMELLEGRILHDVMKTGALPVEQALHITDQVLKALDHAHKKNVVHRDIKPGNLFLCTRNEDPDFVKVLDFGIARYIDANDAFFDDPHQEITTTRQICGTPQYMAPEQIAMGVVDARTDLYALGIVLYRMITGELPFQSKDHRELFRAHLTQAPPTFASVRPGLQLPELEALVMRALAKSPDDRFASAAEMRTALRQLRGRMAGGGDDEFTPISSVASSPSAVSAMSSNPGTLPLTVLPPRRDLTVPLVVVVLVLLGLGAFLWWGRTPADEGDATATALRSADAAPSTHTPADAAPPSEAPLGASNPLPSDVPPSDAPPSGAPPSDAPPSDAPPSDAPPSGAPPSDAPLRTVHITSAPPGARIRWEGRDLGTTPRNIELPVGNHQVFLSRGNDQAALAIEVTEKGKIDSLHAVLRRADGKRPAVVEAPASVAAPASAAPPSAAPASTLRMKLLDEGEARDFEAGGKPPVIPTEKPRVDLLEE